jgi:predicted MFS family arabinose efflux permease
VQRVLELPAFRRLLAAYGLNELAFYFGSVALAVLIYRRTGSALGATAFFLCEQFVPALIAPAIVAKVDQSAARRVLPLLYLTESALFLALASITSRFALGTVLTLVVIDGVAALSARSIARATTVAVTTPHGLLREGNAILNAAFSLAFMAGPAAGGAVVVAGGITEVLLINAGLLTVIALTIFTARGLPDAELEREPTAGRLKAALAYARERAAIRNLLGIQALALIFFTISIPVEIVLAEHSLHAGAGGYGALLATWGGGALVGSVIFARWRRLPARTLISLSAVSLAVGFGLMASAPSLALALVGAALGGGGNGVEAVAARTALQEEVEQSWMARIMSLNDAMYQALPGLGILIGGALASVWSPRAALALAGLGSLVVALAASVRLRASSLAPAVNR